MAIKVKTLRMPNLDSEIKGESESLEKNIENEIEKYQGKGYTVKNIVGGDSFIILVFEK